MDTALHPGSSAALDLNRVATENDIEQLFELVLGRPPDSSAYVRGTAQRGLTVGGYVRDLLETAEFQRSLLSRRDAWNLDKILDDARYRVPANLSRPSAARMKVLLIGSCLTAGWPEILHESADGWGMGLTVDYMPFNNAATLPPMSAAAAAALDFAIVQIPIRSVLPEGSFFGLRADDQAGQEAAFRQACERLRLNLDQALAYNRAHGLRCYVMNFLVPQQNLTGRMMPRYARGNLVHMVEELNRHLWTLCEARPGVQFVDMDAISATMGRRYVQDDSTLQTNHGGPLAPIEMWHDVNRIESVGEIDVIYSRRPASFVQSVFQEVLAMHRTLLQRDSVKIVLFDLDDTLWRGVAAEQAVLGPEMTEGWPLGMLEAVDQLWRRGILVALVSKNDEAFVREAWRQLYQHLFPIENFVAVRVNWAPKAQNIRQILAAVNLLPESALFVDDHPRERGEVRKEIPGLRVIDAPLAEWRRILLWSAETQRAEVNREALARTDMVQAQLRREEERGALDPAAFLAGLGLRVALGAVSSEADAEFGRCFELLNKTNQYNTTGRRWTPAEMRQLLAEGGCLLHLSAQDKYTRYGIVAVAVIRGTVIEQVVMSCRVFGMGVEQALLGTALATIRSWGKPGAVRGLLRETGRNRLCLELFSAHGFVRMDEESWEAPESLALFLPAHMQVGME